MLCDLYYYLFKTETKILSLLSALRINIQAIGLYLYAMHIR